MATEEIERSIKTSGLFEGLHAYSDSGVESDIVDDLKKLANKHNPEREAIELILYSMMSDEAQRVFWLVAWMPEEFKSFLRSRKIYGLRGLKAYLKQKNWPKHLISKAIREVRWFVGGVY